MGSLSRNVAAMAFVILFLWSAILHSQPAAAQLSPNSPKILLHVRNLPENQFCSRVTLTCCNQGNTAGDLGYHLAYVLAAPSTGIRDGGLGIAGIQFGVDYVGTYDPAGTGQYVCVFDWQLCATLEFPMFDWPGPGSGTIITWDRMATCQRGEVAVAGYFYLAAYAATYFRLVPRPLDQAAKVVTCDLQEFQVTDRIGAHTNILAAADFRTGGGFNVGNPCTTACPTAVEPTTWSRIKSQVGR